MTIYHIDYNVRGAKYGDKVFEISIDAKNLKSAKKKIGKKHGYKDGRMITIHRVSIGGYY